MHQRFITMASSRPHQGIIRASIVHYQRIISASSVHPERIKSASSGDQGTTAIPRVLHCLLCLVLLMFEEIAKHLANDAYNDRPRPPLTTHGKKEVAAPFLNEFACQMGCSQEALQGSKKRV